MVLPCERPINCKNERMYFEGIFDENEDLKISKKIVSELNVRQFIFKNHPKSAVSFNRKLFFKDNYTNFGSHKKYVLNFMLFSVFWKFVGNNSSLTLQP